MQVDEILKIISQYEGQPKPLTVFLKAFFQSTKGSYQPLRRLAYGNNLNESLLDKEKREARLLRYLDRQGLIDRKNIEGRWRMILTKKGKDRLQTIKPDLKRPGSYSAQKTKDTTIIIFDVPGSERRKRDWLRSCLKRLGFRKIQQSVWMGKVKIPEEFIGDLRKFNMMEYVEIFIAQKLGSLINQTS